MSIESFKSTCNFYDSIHFRHGFARAGIFTKKEAEILSQCGYVIKQLEREVMLPLNDDQNHMIQFLKGLAEPENEVERVWSKYLAAVRDQVVKVSGFSSKLNGIDYSYNQGDGAW